VQVHSLKVINNIFCVLVVSFLLLITVSGCLDDPESQAQKQLHESTRSALDQARDGLYQSKPDDSEDVDQLQKASDTISSAISRNRKARGAVGSATFAKANISFAQGQKLRVQLQLESVPVTEAIGSIALINNRTGDLAIQVSRLNGLVDSNGEQVAVLKDLINGSDKQVGLKSEMQDSAAELADLESQKADLASSCDMVELSGSKLQDEANAKFRQAETASGDVKVSLSAEGFELLSKSNSEMVKAQGLSNRIAALEGKIGIVGPVAEKLQNDLEQVQGRISELENSPDFAQLKGQLSQVNRQYRESQEELQLEIKKLVALKKNYAEMTEAVAGFLKSAIADYEKVGSGQLRSAALERIAISSFWIGALYSENAVQEKHIKLAIQYIYSVVEDTSSLDGVVQSCDRQSSKLGKQAFEYFDLAVENYGKLAGSGGGDHACYITKRHALALYAKYDLADKLGDYNLADDASEDIEAILKKAEECDPDFSRTVLARVIDGEIDFVSVLPVDNTSAYEETRKLFQNHGWPKLPAEEREAAVNMLLAGLARLEEEATFDRQAYERILGPEKMKLENALKRGFEDIEDFEDDGLSDPNFL
jgi:hypothetical protein